MVGYRRVSLIALIFFSALISPMGFAKSVNLKTINVELASDYGTLYGEIHFDERDLEVALRVERIVKTDLIKVVNYFHHVPKNIVHFNVDPYMRLTNGNATVFPTNIINLYNFPASNNEHLIVFDDWLRGLVFHEYIHITHLDQTRGFVESGRKIFGNIAKLLPSDTPRWFTEGIAVWGESHLMGADGRLGNPLFKKELLVQFLRVDYCKTIDCLDDPGVYPGGQLAYWAGAQFIEYLENKKAGTVKCLVEDNSDNFPFFLNHVFNNCAGDTAQNLFAQFRTDLINSQPKVTPEKEAWGDKISNAFGSDDLQKGIYLDGNILFKVERDRQSEALVSYDLQENVNMLISKFHFPISDIAGMTTMPLMDNDQSDHGKFLIVAFNEDPRFRENNRAWKLINSETLLIEADLPLQNDPSYVVGLGNNRFLTASFVDNKWRIERQRVDLGSKKAADVDVVHQFPSNVNLTEFKKIGQKIFLKIAQEGGVTTLLVSDLTLENLYKIYEAKNFYDTPVLNENFLIIREKESLELVEMNDGFKKISISAMDKNLLVGVTSAEVNDERVLVLESRLKTKSMTPKESLAVIKQTVSAASSFDLVAVNFDEKPNQETPNNVAVESFPQINHLYPYYWFLATGTNENLFSIGAMTTFSDPMNINVINATVLTYPAEKKFGGNLDFVHKFTSVSDLWTVNGYFNHEYSKTDFSDRVNQTTEGSLGSGYAFLMKRWTFVPGVFVGGTKTNDFISDRSTTQVGVNGVAMYDAQSFDDYFQNLVLQIKVQNDQPNIGDSYMNLKALLSAEGRFYERLVGGVKTSYGKLYKTGFTQGVIYGGGTTTAGTTRWHEFYGLPYSNAYGNEIFTLRLYVDYNFWYINRGYEFMPLFIKEAHLLLGREMMTADRIILDNSMLRDKTIHSAFIGPRLKMNILYYIPVDVDLIFSTIKHPSGRNVNQVELGINADLF